MPSGRSPGTGRTVWDFLFFLSERRSVLSWTTGLAGLAIVGFVAAVSAGYIEVHVKGLAQARGAPWADWTIEKIALGPSECDAVAAEALRIADAKGTISNKDNPDEMYRTGAVGSLLASIVCLRQQDGSLIYIGVAGDDYDRARNLRNLLKTPFERHLLRK